MAVGSLPGIPSRSILTPALLLILSLCFECLFIAAMTEQIVFEGEQEVFLRAALAAFAAWCLCLSFAVSGAPGAARIMARALAVGCAVACCTLPTASVYLHASVIILAIFTAVTGRRDENFRHIPSPLFWLAAPALFFFSFAKHVSMGQLSALRGDPFVLLTYDAALSILCVTLLFFAPLCRRALPFYLRMSLLLPAGLALVGMGAVAFTLPASPIVNEHFFVSLGISSLMASAFTFGVAFPVPARGLRILVTSASAVCFLVLTLMFVVRAAVKVQPGLPSAGLREAPPLELLTYLLTAEDPIFPLHGGLDFFRLSDAAREFFEQGEFRRGGSTISMQLVKVLFLSEEKTVFRKFEQIVGAVALEQRYSKREILETYLSVIPFAPGVHGVAEAAARFYGKQLKELSPEQSLILVLSIYDPSDFNPGMAILPTHIRSRSAVIKVRERIFRDRLKKELQSIYSLRR